MRVEAGENRRAGLAGRTRPGRRPARAGRAALRGWLLGAWVLLASPGGLCGDEGQEARRARLEALSPAEKQNLLKQQGRFAKLEFAEQERLRALSRQMEEDEHGDQLREVMRRYHDWLKTLPPYQRAQLLELPAEARVKRVQEILAEQARRGGRPGGSWGEIPHRQWRSGGFPEFAKRSLRRPDPADMEGLFVWMDGYAKRHGGELLEKLPAPQRGKVQQELTSVTDPVRRQELLGWIWLWWQLDSRGKLPAVSDQELAQLRSKLSPATRKRLEGLPAAEQWRTAVNLITTFMLHQYSSRQTGAPLPAFSEEELAQFFERELTDKQRDELLNLSGDEMQRRLWRMYVEWKIRQMPFRQGRETRPGQPPFGPGLQAPPGKPGTGEASPVGTAPWKKRLPQGDKQAPGATGEARARGESPAAPKGKEETGAASESKKAATKRRPAQGTTD